MASGPIFDHFILSAVPSSGPIFDHSSEAVPGLSVGPIFDHNTEVETVALFEVLRRQTSKAHTISIGTSDGADIAILGRTTAGSAFLYTDANTTSITIGGGASLGALLDLRDTNTTTLRSTSGQNLQLTANGAASCVISTNSVTRVSISSAGAINLGSATNASAVGDLATSDGTRELLYLASTNALTLQGAAASIDSDSALTIAGTNATALTLGHTTIGVSISGWSNMGSTSSATALGDLATSDGTRQLLFDASAGELSLTGTGSDISVESFYIPRILARVASIDGAATGTTNLYTVPSGKTAIVEKVILRVTAATAAVGDAAAGIGIAAGEDDIVSSQVLTGLATVDDAFVLTPAAGKFRIADAAEIIKLGIDTADTGTALTLSADVIGYLI